MSIHRLHYFWIVGLWNLQLPRICGLPKIQDRNSSYVIVLVVRCAIGVHRSSAVLEVVTTHEVSSLYVTHVVNKEAHNRDGTSGVSGIAYSHSSSIYCLVKRYACIQKSENQTRPPTEPSTLQFCAQVSKTPFKHLESTSTIARELRKSPPRTPSSPGYASVMGPQVSGKQLESVTNYLVHLVSVVFYIGTKKKRCAVLEFIFMRGGGRRSVVEEAEFDVGRRVINIVPVF